MQQQRLGRPVDPGGRQHAAEHGALHLPVLQAHDHEQADEHGDHAQHHHRVASAHLVLRGGGRQRAEEVPHGVEGAAGFRVDAHVAAKADVHQHQADGGPDAQADAQGDGLHDLLPHVEHGQHDEHDALHQDDDQRRLEGFQVGQPAHGGQVAHHHGEEAVQPHAGGHHEGLVGQQAHAEGADGGSHAGGQEHAVPQRGSLRAEVREQVGVQGDDVGHRHEGGQTRDQLGANVGVVLFQLEDSVHGQRISSPGKWDFIRRR